MFSKNGTFELQLLFMKLDFLLILCNYCLSIFCAEMDWEWMHLSRTDKWYMHGISQFITDAKAHAGNGNPVFCPCKDCKNHRNFRQIESIRSHLITSPCKNHRSLKMKKWLRMIWPCQTIRYGLCMARLVWMFCRKTMMMWTSLT